MAQEYFGLSYEIGERVAKDAVEAAKCAVEAVKWYRKAAKQGNAFAQFRLGFYYPKGKGVAKDEMEAVAWFRRAADQGYPAAQSKLAICYGNGDGMVKNEIESYKWTLLAVAQGDEVAKKNAANDEYRFTPAQRAEGQRLALEWEAKHVQRVAAQEEQNQPADGTAGVEPKITGTGFMITRNGYLVTNYHVVKDSRTVRIQTGT